MDWFRAAGKKWLRLRSTVCAGGIRAVVRRTGRGREKQIKPPRQGAGEIESLFHNQVTSVDVMSQTPLPSCGHPLPAGGRGTGRGARFDSKNFASCGSKSFPQPASSFFQPEEAGAVGRAVG